MHYYTIEIYTTDWHGDMTVLDHRTYQADADSLERIEDEFFHTILYRSKQYAVPKHFDLLLLDASFFCLRAVARYRDGMSFWAWLRERRNGDAQDGLLSVCKRDIPHYKINFMRPGTLIIEDVDYTRENYIDVLEKFLKGVIS